MFKQGDVILIGEDAPTRAYVGTIFRMLEDSQEEGFYGGVPILKCQAEVLKTGVEALQVRGAEEAALGQGVDFQFTQSWLGSLRKIGEGDIYVGQRVKIREDSRFYGEGRANPVDVAGEVIRFIPGDWLPLVVRWENGPSNAYSFKDLEVVTKAPKPTKKVKKYTGILAQISKAVEVLQGYDDYPTASYVVIKKGVVPEHRVSNTACHNGLRTDEPGARLVVSCIKRGVDDYPWFYKWLIDESPWSSAFYRRYAWSKKNQCVVVRTDIAANFMFGALFATRVWENPEAMEFVKSFKSKLPISLLYAISKGVTINGRGYSIYRARGGHWPFEHSPSKEVVKNFVLGTPKTLSETYSKLGNAPYGSVNTCFGESNFENYWLFDASQRAKSAKRRKGFGVTRAFFDSKKKFLEFLTKQYEKVMK